MSEPMENEILETVTESVNLPPVEGMTDREMLREIVVFCRSATDLLKAFEQFGKMGPAKALMSVMGGKKV